MNPAPNAVSGIGLVAFRNQANSPQAATKKREPRRGENYAAEFSRQGRNSSGCCCDEIQIQRYAKRFYFFWREDGPPSGPQSTRFGTVHLGSHLNRVRAKLVRRRRSQSVLDYKWSSVAA